MKNLLSFVTFLVIAANYALAAPSTLLKSSESNETEADVKEALELLKELLGKFFYQMNTKMGVDNIKHVIKPYGNPSTKTSTSIAPDDYKQWRKFR